jgi:hypothetical protein
MKILNFEQFIKEDNAILFSGQDSVGNTSTKDNISTVSMKGDSKTKKKKIKLPQGVYTQPPLEIPQSFVNRMLQ